MRFTVLSSKAVSCYLCDKQHQPSLVNYMPTTDQWEIQNCFARQYTVLFVCLFVFFPDFLSVQKMVRVIEGKFVWK